MPPTRPQLRVIDYRQLRLDTENPRHRAQSDESNALAALIRDDPAKLVVLANDICRNGLDPINPLLVLERENGYVVLEGNRRLVALHLLTGHGLEHLAPADRRLLDTHSSSTDDMAIQCVVVESRADARHWIELRHTGQNEGAGVVPWSATQIARFRPGTTQAHKGLAFLELVRSIFPRDAGIEIACEQIERDKITNLGRLAGDPDVRDRLGVMLGQDTEYALEEAVHDAPARVRALIVSLAGDTSVAELINKDRRLEYVERILDSLASEVSVTDSGDIDHVQEETSDPVDTENQDYANNQQDSRETQEDPRNRTSVPSQTNRRRQVFQGLDLSALGERIEHVNLEVQSLSLGRYPNAIAILIRCMLDMAVESFLAEKEMPQDGSYAERVLRAAAVLDPINNPRQQDSRLRAIRAWMNSDEHLFSAATLHQFVHNRHWQPVAQDLVDIASNLQPLLTWLGQECSQ